MTVNELNLIQSITQEWAHTWMRVGLDISILLNASTRLLQLTDKQSLGAHHGSGMALVELLPQWLGEGV